MTQKYVHCRLPADYTQVLRVENPPDALIIVSQHLYIVQRVYLYPIKKHFPAILVDGSATIREFEYRFRYLLTTMLPQNLIVKNLESLFKQQATPLQRQDPIVGRGHQRSPFTPRDFRENVRILQQVGLGDDKAKKTFAEVMYDVLRERVKSEVAGEWSSPTNFEDDLRHWVEDQYANLVAETLDQLEDDVGLDEENAAIVSQTEVQQWQAMGLDQFGRLRTDVLFDIVIRWDDTRGAIEELRGFVTSALGRNYVVNTFNAATAHRLLHPGASTIEILQVYINVIRAFTTLDPKGVLLDRVSRSIRRYLRERDDTVNIVVGGLLADPDPGVEDPSSTGETLIELANEIDKSSAIKDHDDEDADLDFDDMNWSPDPVDAGPEYRRSRNFDIIGSLISLFESKNVFVAEFQKVLGERLLRAEFDFDREIRVLELLKLRFGETALQACEVMLRDILDSRRVDTFIQKGISAAIPTITLPKIRARILSHLFWPPLHSETFNVPPRIIALQAAYSNAFESLKASRKLTWLPALGQVTVVLDLEDRTVTEVVQTWQAAVIYAFENPNDSTGKSVTLSLPHLMSTLEMSESLVRNALTFWIGKLVLKQTAADPPAFTVLETLSDEAAAQEGTTSAAIAAAAETVTAAAAPAMLSEREIVREKMEVYKQYVVGMLTNGGAMGLAQIVMMLKMTVPGGFPLGNEELKEFLEDEVRAGRLDFAGGTYKMVK